MVKIARNKNLDNLKAIQIIVCTNILDDDSVFMFVYLNDSAIFYAAENAQTKYSIIYSWALL